MPRAGHRDLRRPRTEQAREWILGSCRFDSADRYSTCAMPVSDGGRVRVIASDPKRNLFNQRYSPDQKWIAFLAHDLMYSSTSTVYVTPASSADR